MMHFIVSLNSSIKGRINLYLNMEDWGTRIMMGYGYITEMDYSWKRNTAFLLYTKSWRMKMPLSRDQFLV